MSIVLTKEQKAEDAAKRIKAFTDDFRALEEKHQISLRALITPEGPVLDLRDLKEYA